MLQHHVPWALSKQLPLLAGRSLLQAKVTELVAPEPRVLLPDRLLHRVLARLARDPDAFPGQHAALCAIDPRLQPDDRGRPVSVFFLPLLAADNREREADAGTDQLEAHRARVRLTAEQLEAMADLAKPKSPAGLLEELGYGATASEETVRELLQQVRNRKTRCACAYAVLLQLCTQAWVAKLKPRTARP